MNKHYWLLTALLSLAGCDRDTEPLADEHAEEAPRGQNGGRLLEDREFALELAIFESGVEPEFHAWATQDDEPVGPSDVSLTVELARLGGAVDRIDFTPQGD